MKTLLLLGFVGVPVPLLAATDAIDVPQALTAYGVAAPFAGLLWWLLRREQSKNEELQRKIDELQSQALARERDLIGRVAPMIYDGARLYERGNAQLAQLPAKAGDLESLALQVQSLIEKLQER